MSAYVVIAGFSAAFMIAQDHKKAPFIKMQPNHLHKALKGLLNSIPTNAITHQAIVKFVTSVMKYIILPNWL